MSGEACGTPIAVLIVNWNTRDLLAECLEALPDAAGALSLQVIVVDNASTDGSAEMVKARFPYVTLLALDCNIGFVGGNNLAYAEAANVSYVLLLNPDAILKSGALPTMVDFLDKASNAGACGPLTLNPDGTLQLSWARFPTLSGELWSREDRWFSGARSPGSLSLQFLRARVDAPPVDWVSGACLLLRREALIGLGSQTLLDPRFHMYSEETDLCLRLRRAGWTTHLVPQAEVVHHYGQSSRQVPAKTLRLLFVSKFLFFRKHYGLFSAGMLRLLVAAKYAPRWLTFALLGRTGPRDRQWAILQSLTQPGAD